MKIRGYDGWGSGHYGAPRNGGRRKHRGCDYVNHVNEAITAIEAGTVSKIGRPYSPKSAKKRHFRYIEISYAPNIRHRYFYVESLVQIGDSVEKGQIIGWAQDLNEVYPGITQHYHLEIIKNGRRIDPCGYLKNYSEATK